MENFMHGKRVHFLLGIVMSFAIALVGWVTPAMAEPSQSNKAIALRYATEGWGTKPNWEKVWEELVSPDVVLHFNSFPAPIVGLAANKEFSKDLFRGFPTIKNKVENIVAEGDAVIYRSTLEGSQTGEFLGMPATGKPVKMNDFTMCTIKDGKIREMWYETNLLSLMQQLGLTPDSK
jgi:predicted ester cyclase